MQSEDRGKRFPPNNPWNNNPCFGIWARKDPSLVTEDSWGVHDNRERYWSVVGDYNPEENLVRLHPYTETMRKARLSMSNIMLRPEFVFERFEFLGHGSSLS